MVGVVGGSVRNRWPVISQVVKRTIDRQRPVWPDPFEAPDSFSFPSGQHHGGIYGWVVFGIVALYLLRGPWNRIVGVALIAFGVLMGPSRVVFGVHWPTDVLGGGSTPAPGCSP